MTCDQELYEQLQMVLDPEIVDEAIESCDATLLLEACSNSLDEGGVDWFKSVWMRPLIKIQWKTSP